MKLLITDTEIRQAVLNWLLEKHGVVANPNELVPTWVTEGTFEDARTSMTGFELDLKDQKLA
jgi:hypothetical protein